MAGPHLGCTLLLMCIMHCVAYYNGYARNAALACAPLVTHTRNVRAGYDNCPSTIQAGVVPGHGTMQSGPGPYVLRLKSLGTQVFSYSPMDVKYTLELASTTSQTFRGWIINSFDAANGIPSAWSGATAGSILLPSPLPNNYAARAMSNCNNGVTHVNGNGNVQTLLQMLWDPTDQSTGNVPTGDVYFWAVVVQCNLQCSPQNVYQVFTRVPQAFTSASPLPAPPSATSTASSTGTATGTQSRTATATASATGTTTATQTGSGTSSSTGTASSTGTSTGTVSATSTSTSTASGTATSTTSASGTPSPSNTPSVTPSPSFSSSPGSSASPTISLSSTATLSATSTATSTATGTSTQSVTATSSSSATQTASSTQTATGTPTSSATQSITSTSSPSRTSTASGTSTATASPSTSRTASPSVSASTPVSASAYPYSYSFSSDVVLRWRVDTSTVSFRMEATSNVWLGLARSPSRTMLNGPSGSGPAVIGIPATNTVRQALLRTQDLSGISNVDTSLVTMTAGSIVTGATGSVLSFTRPLAATGHSSELAINPNVAQGFIWANGFGPDFQQHLNYGFASITLLPPGCTRSATCNNHGSCPTASSTTCACDAGYAGQTCTSCDVGFVSSSGATCVPAASSSTVSASVTLRLTLTNFAATAGADGSTTRATFVAALVADLVAATGSPATRFNISSINTATAAIVITILPGANSTNVSSATAIAQVLSQQAQTPGSALRSGAVTSSLDASTPLVFSFADSSAPQFTAQLRSGVVMSWSVTSGTLAVKLTLTGSAANQWFGLGINSGPNMIGTDAIAFEPSNAIGQQVTQYVLGDKTSSGVVAVSASSSTLTGVSVTVGSASTVVSFSRPLAAGAYSGAVSIPASGSTTLVFACGASTGDRQVARHSLSDAGAATVNFASGSYTPISLSQPLIRYAHGVMMALAWGLAIPIGVIAARFGKRVPPTSGPKACWFVTHRIVQSAGVLVAIIGFILALVMTPSSTHFTLSHHICGLVVMILGILQPINAMLRPHVPKPGEAKSMLRMAWEVGHKSSGYVAVILAMATIFLGIKQLGLSSGWTAAYAVIVALLGATFVGAQVYFLLCAPRPPVKRVLTSTDPPEAPVESAVPVFVSPKVHGDKPSIVVRVASPRTGMRTVPSWRRRQDTTPKAADNT